MILVWKTKFLCRHKGLEFRGMYVCTKDKIVSKEKRTKEKKEGGENRVREMCFLIVMFFNFVLHSCFHWQPCVL